MQAWATAAGGDGGLVITISGEDWSFLLRRADLKHDARFLPFYGRRIDPSDVAVFLPNWRSLQWKKVPDNFLGRSECSAVDGEFNIVALAAAGSAKRHEDVVQAFLRFMASDPTTPTPAARRGAAG